MIDPRVSVPMPNTTSPPAVADPGPADDPLEPRSRFHGLFVCPRNQLVALRERAHRKLRHQHRAGVREPFDDRGVVVEHLVLERARHPTWSEFPWSRRDPSHPRDAVQWPLVCACADVSICLRGLSEREILGQRDDAIELRSVLLEPLRYIFVRSVADTSRR